MHQNQEEILFGEYLDERCLSLLHSFCRCLLICSWCSSTASYEKPSQPPRPLPGHTLSLWVRRFVAAHLLPSRQASRLRVWELLEGRAGFSFMGQRLG